MSADCELVEAARNILEGGYVSEFIEEERGDYVRLRDALATGDKQP